MNTIKKLVFSAIISITPICAGAQTLKEANDAYNEASKIIACNKEGTIELFEKALKICKTLGAEGDTIRWKIEGYMAGLYYEVGNSSYKDKNYKEAIPKLKKAIEVSDIYNDQNYKQRSTKLLANSYYNLGNAAVNASLLDTAIVYYLESTNVEPKAYKWFNIGQIYLKKADEAKMEETMNKTLEMAKSENDTATISKTNKLCRQYFYSQGKVLQTKNTGKAIEYLDKAVKYDPKFADAYWIKTQICYKLKKWTDAADAGNSAIANETDSNEKYKYYFKLGWIYVYLQDGVKACDAFKHASRSKEFEEEAKVNMKNLHCN
jgi:tetratricopeptide (TPR) repeat protein